MKGPMSEVLATLSSVLGNGLNVRCEIQNEVKKFLKFHFGWQGD